KFHVRHATAARFWIRMSPDSRVTHLRAVPARTNHGKLPTSKDEVRETGTEDDLDKPISSPQVCPGIDTARTTHGEEIPWPPTTAQRRANSHRNASASSATGWQPTFPTSTLKKPPSGSTPSTRHSPVADSSVPAT